MNFLQALAFSVTIFTLVLTPFIPVLVVVALHLSFFRGAIIIFWWNVLFFAFLVWASPLIEDFLP